MKHRNWIAWIWLGFVFAGCEHADPLSPDTSTATLSSIQANIFDRNCALSGCHNGSGTSLPGSMDLRSGQAFSNLVGVTSTERPTLKRIDAGDADNSYLVRKLEGGPDISGSRMPFGRPALSQEEIDLVRQWVAEGAANN